MNHSDFKPDRSLFGFWLTLWAVYFFSILVVCILPLAVAAAFNENVPLGLAAGIIFACCVVVGVPFLVWIPAYVRSLDYSIDERAVRARSGVIWKRNVTVPFSKITNIDTTSGPLQRAFGLATLHVQTAGAGGSQGGVAELRIYGVRHAQELKERISARVYGAAADDGTGGGTPAPDAALGEILAELRAIRAALERR